MLKKKTIIKKFQIFKKKLKKKTKKKKLNRLRKKIKFFKNFNNISIKNFKKLFFFIKELKKRKLNLLLIGGTKIYKILNSIFIIKNKNKIQKFKNIFFYKEKWQSGAISTKKNFYKTIKKKKINLIIILKPHGIIKSCLNELVMLKLPIALFTTEDQLYFHKFKNTYPIVYKLENNELELIFLIYCFKLLFLQK